MAWRADLPGNNSDGVDSQLANCGHLAPRYLLRGVPNIARWTIIQDFVRVHLSAAEDRRLQSSHCKNISRCLRCQRTGHPKIFYADLYDDAEEDEGSYIFYLSLIP
jgi:hypothetical protein